MVKCCGHYVTFQEVPNEVSLVFSITNCQHRCPGCYSPWLQEDVGDELTEHDIAYLLMKYSGAVTCVCFMGEGGDPAKLGELIRYVNECGLKTCLYSGRDIDVDLSPYAVYPLLDYIKTGSYKKEFGGLDRPTTNQKMWRLSGLTKDGAAIYDDITSWFWKKKD